MEVWLAYKPYSIYQTLVSNIDNSSHHQNNQGEPFSAHVYPPTHYSVSSSILEDPSYICIKLLALRKHGRAVFIPQLVVILSHATSSFTSAHVCYCINWLEALVNDLATGKRCLEKAIVASLVMLSNIEHSEKGFIRSTNM